MKTKHKLKLLSILPKGFQEYEDLKIIIFRKMGNTTEIKSLKLKPSPSQLQKDLTKVTMLR